MTTPVPAPPAATLSGFGLAATLPDEWEGRIYRRAEPSAAFAPRSRAATPDGRGTDGWAGEQTHPVMHLATFALPAQRGDYGSGAVEIMGPADVFVALLEFGPECLGSALFRTVGLPTVRAGSFDPQALQRRLAGQAGCQLFFTAASRAWCLYVVIGDARRAAAAAARVNALLAGLEVDA
ncbi:hypothetical protein JL107_12425 [Nakamurella flavida]|uniref:Uncharacterized protein n=1 Tax=Nakamurella flavida TaxID=363630 RepID=A0A938YQT6_9ACTN|nr:hypothetical protein [Nakamurella flavida]MBM9477250.1 hypothetical protein [Nakamurella flavida]MDP9779706.1 hypothetical protein [Nakamurella flavida]